MFKPQEDSQPRPDSDFKETGAVSGKDKGTPGLGVRLPVSGPSFSLPVHCRLLSPPHAWPW
jgi:hypothetical protein